MHEYKNIYINDWYSIVGPVEKKKTNIKYDLFMDDYYYGEDTIEKAEIKMQQVILNRLIALNNPELVVGMDLLNQLSTTNMAMVNRNVPFLGIYAACSSFCEGLIILANLIENNYVNNALFITSSHNLTAEKQYRFPIEYGAPKPKRSTFTATASIGTFLSNKPSNIRIVNSTIGSVIDSTIKDVFNMGAVMAPAVYDTLIKHLKQTKTTINDYDLILTGDLGLVGANILKELLKQNNIKLKKYIDAGSSLYKNNEYSGASGPTVLPLVLFGSIILNKKYQKILLLATGSLHSPIIVNQKNCLPAICHAVTIEVIK